MYIYDVYIQPVYTQTSSYLNHNHITAVTDTAIYCFQPVHHTNANCVMNSIGKPISIVQSQCTRYKCCNGSHNS
ncbi:hypothetical protein EB796_023684 [Bugula neritina]|uniref:Uncharacterized protein n=1 Tax=Bugula neritina TaxID=10212 RepID=A0A7J7IVR3_BUGNE|nr:hypothetical protein EB796_023684 [Bugula neritina]